MRTPDEMWNYLAKCFRICHILDIVCIQKRTHLLENWSISVELSLSTNNKIRMSGWTTTTPPWWSSYWTLTSEWNYAKQAIFGEKNDASTVPPVTPLLFTFLDFMKRTRDIVQKNLTDTDQSRFRIVSQISWGVTIADKRLKNANPVLWSIESNCHPVSRYR